MYKIVVFKRLYGDTGEIYGAKSFMGNLDRACKRLVKKYGLHAEVRTVAPGIYDIARGQARLEIVR